jgi:ABC-type phosphate/phosphonate transport system substrate-binding protein
MKKVSFLVLAILLVLLVSSCGEEVTSIESAYTFGISSHKGGTGFLTAWQEVENYLENELKLPFGTKVYSGSNTANTDKKAKSEFAAAKVKIDEKRLDTITAGGSKFQFVYSVRESGGNVLDEYNYHFQQED